MGIYDEISSNKRKSFFLIFIFMGFVILLGILIGMIYGNSYFGLILAVLFGVIYFLFSYYGGATAILTMTHAKEATKPQYTYLINTVEGLSIAAGLPKIPKVYVIDDSALNAFATGRDPEHSAVTVTTGLLQKLNRVELEGVIAHELSHIKNYDIRVMMLSAVMVGLTVLLSDFLLRSFLWNRGDDREGNQLSVIFIVIGVVLAILSPFIAELIKLAISRKREFLADASGALLTRYPEGLASALEKIAQDKEPLEVANNATAHLYIANPFRGLGLNRVSNLFSTHPPIGERIKALRDLRV